MGYFAFNRLNSTGFSGSYQPDFAEHKRRGPVVSQNSPVWCADSMMQPSGNVLRRSRSPLAIFAATSVLASAAIAVTTATASDRIVPAAGSYVASGAGDPSRYSVRGQVMRRGGRRRISLQVRDTCGGLATFADTAIGRDSADAPTFFAQVGGARVSGRWTGPTRIAGRVKTPCGAAQGYVMRLAD
jgi:hypothetical protein